MRLRGTKPFFRFTGARLPCHKRDGMERLDKKIFGTLFFSIFSSITGVGIVVPLLPVYAHDMGASGLYIGLIFGVFAFSRTVFLPYFGRKSDQQGRKPFIVAGLLGYTVISFAFTLAKRVEYIILIRFIQGIASAMIMPATQAYVGEIAPPKREGMVMGFFNLSIFVGLSVGPVIGGIMKDWISLDSAFVTMGCLSGIGFFLSLLLLPSVEPARTLKTESDRGLWSRLMKDRLISGIFLYRLVYTAAISTIWGFLPVFANLEFAISSSEIGILIMLGILVSGLLQTPMGIAADKHNKRLMIVSGGCIVIGSLMGFKLSRGFWDLFFANVAFGVGGSMSMAPLMAIAVQKGAESRAMGGVMGLMTMAHSLGMMSGAMLMGILMDYMNMRLAFLFISLSMLLGTLLFVWFTEPCDTDVP